MKHILIVDDDVIMNNSIKAMLSEKYRVSQLTSGTQVMDFLHLKETDLVLLDMYMHDLDGMEILRVMKADPLTASIPVIFLTGEESVAVEAECLQLGAMDYVHKPISRQVLEQRVGNHLMIADSLRRIRQMYENTGLELENTREIIQHDELTGLWSRQHIYEAYAEAVRVRTRAAPWLSSTWTTSNTSTTSLGIKRAMGCSNAFLPSSRDWRMPVSYRPASAGTNFVAAARQQYAGECAGPVGLYL